jgi:hypothetical protein
VWKVMRMAVVKTTTAQTHRTKKWVASQLQGARLRVVSSQCFQLHYMLSETLYAVQLSPSFACLKLPICDATQAELFCVQYNILDAMQSSCLRRSLASNSLSVTQLMLSYSASSLIF